MEAEVNGSRGWRPFISDHRKMFVLFVAAAIIAVIGAILVFLWFVGQAQINGLVPSTLGEWTMGFALTFLLNLLFWEVLLIGIPSLIVAVAIWLWWRRLPIEKRMGYGLFGRSSRSRDGGNAFSFLVSIAFLLKVYLDGNWDLPFATWTLDYLVYSWISALAWVLIIFAIPVIIGLVWWISSGRKRKW
jgi:hypothetical protein